MFSNNSDFYIHADDFSILQLIEMCKRCIHGDAALSASPRVHAEGRDPITISQISVYLCLIIDPFRRQFVEAVGNDRLRADIGAGIRETCGLGPGRIGSQSSEQIFSILCRRPFIGSANDF